MKNDKKIFWVSSFPKSGNTWLRLILCGLFFSKNGKINNFKLLSKIPKFDITDNFKFIKNISNKDYELIFSKKEYDEEALLAYSKYWIDAQKNKEIIDGNFSFFKTHNARVNINSNYYTNSETTLGFLYIYRDPRDIIISYAKHMNKNIDFTLDFIMNGQIMGKERNQKIMPEITLNWEDHFLSWKKFSDVPNLFIKYEDLLDDPISEINNIINFFEKNFKILIENKEKKINNIIESTNINNLKKIEKNYGFVENNSTNFFRVGKNNQWRKILKKEQIKLLEKKFFDNMKYLNYI